MRLPGISERRHHLEFTSAIYSAALKLRPGLILQQQRLTCFACLMLTVQNEHFKPDILPYPSFKLWIPVSFGYPENLCQTDSQPIDF
jgi:hypothetical protein